MFSRSEARTSRRCASRGATGCRTPWAAEIARGLPRPAVVQTLPVSRRRREPLQSRTQSLGIATHERLQRCPRTLDAGISDDDRESGVMQPLPRCSSSTNAIPTAALLLVHRLREWRARPRERSLIVHSSHLPW